MTDRWLTASSFGRFAALALLATQIVWCGCSKKAPMRGRTVPVKRGPVEVVLRSKGELKAREFTRIHSEVEMEAKIIQLAKEGETVKAGDVLVKLDPTELKQRIDDLKANLDQALVELDAAVTEVQIQETDNKNRVEKADLTLKQAQQELEKYEQGNAPIEKRKLEIRLEETDSDLNRKQEKYAQMPDLLKEGFVTASQVEEERINVEKAKVEWETAKRELEVFKTYRYPMEMERKKAEVKQAESDLDAVKKRNASQLKQRQVTKQGRETRVQKLRDEIADLEMKLGKMVILAPTGGLVIYGEPDERRWRRGSEDIQVGTRVWPQQTIITLPDLSEMMVSFRVHESDINKVSPGMEGLVTVESVGKKTFTGRILRIAKLANSGGWRSDPEVKEFDVEMLLQGKDLGLRPGVSAQVEIVCSRVDGVIRVPISAIHGRPGAFYCIVDAPGGPVKKELKLGLISETHVEVLAGLAEGEEVILGPPPDLGGEKKAEGDEGGMLQEAGKSGEEGAGKRPGSEGGAREGAEKGPTSHSGPAREGGGKGSKGGGDFRRPRDQEGRPQGKGAVRPGGKGAKTGN